MKNKNRVYVRSSQSLTVVIFELKLFSNGAAFTHSAHSTPVRESTVQALPKFKNKDRKEGNPDKDKEFTHTQPQTIRDLATPLTILTRRTIGASSSFLPCAYMVVQYSYAPFGIPDNFFWWKFFSNDL